MKLTLARNIIFETNDEILSVCAVSADEWIMLLISGAVVRYNVNNSSGTFLFSAVYQFNTPETRFDIAAPSTIYAMDGVVVVVNDYRSYGFLYYEDRYKRIDLYREDYYANESRYPIALYKDDAGVPHLIYGKAWNRLHIMNLDTRQVLTATKSLIEEHAEERHLAFYATRDADDMQPWPAPYNYFHGALMMSPDNKHFMSTGWVWGSLDSFNVYEVADFIANARIRDQTIGHWEHSNRPACWIDERTVAVAIYPWEEENLNDEDEVIYAKLRANKDSPVEVHLYDITKEKSDIVKRIVLDTQHKPRELHYSRQSNSLITFSKEGGLAVYDLDGTVLLRDAAFMPDNFYPELNVFITAKDKTVSVHQLEL